MENVKLYVYVVLKHILDLGQKSPLDQLDEDDFGSIRRTDSDATKAGKTTRRTASGKQQLSKQLDLLDLEGPKLIIGARSWLLFYQIIGQLNWLGKPLWLSFLYKIIVLAVVAYNLGGRFVTKLYHLNIVNENYRNPIFLFISFLTVITLIGQGLLSFRANLLDLCPFFKILSTPKLCFVREEVQHIVGTRWLKWMLLFFVYHTLLMSMLVSRDLNHFIDEFRLPYYLLDLFTLTVLVVSMTGMSLLDLYVRTCFGHWLLALKNHIESRFTHLHRHQRRLMRLQQQQQQLAHQQVSATNSMDVLSISETMVSSNYLGPAHQQRPLLTFDEIQKHLNKMDDHLEATRSVQIGSLVLLSLNAFLLNGALFLLSYHLLADQHNLYHGFLVLLLAINCIYLMFLCYSGDRWVFYALSSFTQTVEDEYFMQSDIRPLTSPQLAAPAAAAADAMSSIDGPMGELGEEEEGGGGEDAITVGPTNAGGATSHHMLLIKKKDVLFCHEFLHQFENHLATPWSNLTVKTHLHMLRTFVTLIAAQIIFDHEH